MTLKSKRQPSAVRRTWGLDLLWQSSAKGEHASCRYDILSEAASRIIQHCISALYIEGKVSDGPSPPSHVLLAQFPTSLLLLLFSFYLGIELLIKYKNGPSRNQGGFINIPTTSKAVLPPSCNRTWAIDYPILLQYSHGKKNKKASGTLFSLGEPI